MAISSYYQQYTSFKHRIIIAYFDTMKAKPIILICRVCNRFTKCDLVI